jgi:serine/threonine-protein kinase
MSQPPLERLEQLLDEALERMPEDRATFLDAACRDDDPAIRRELEALLDLHEQAETYFDQLSSDIVAVAALEIDSAPGARLQIGPYQTIEAIGHGGMGAVYRAQRVDGAYEHQVAVKLLHQDMDSPELRARFLCERQILADLAHDRIAHLLDGGVTTEGRPYFVMEHIAGVPITAYCRQQRLTLIELLRLFLEVIEAVTYLHTNLVVHRDLKPSNILVDANGHVKLLDFGIAKLIDDSEPAATTRTAERMMTPQYAAPEQLLGRPITTATDVYALGVLLYELLTGQRPHDRAAVDERSIARESTTAPSNVLRSGRAGHVTAEPHAEDDGPSPQVATAWRRIRGDLDAICLKALRAEPEARYRSAEQLGEDLQRYVKGLPVQARRGTFAYRVGKLVQRHRYAALAAAAALLLLIAGFAHERTLRAAAEEAEREAQQEAAKAVAVSEFLRELLSSSNPNQAQGREVTVAEVLDRAASRIDEGSELAEQPEVEAAVRRTIGHTYTSLRKLDEALPHLQRAVELHGGLDSRHPEALKAIGDLGALYTRMDRYEEAEALLRKVIALRTEINGAEHQLTLIAMNRLADLYWSRGAYDEVEAIDRKTLEIRRRTLGEEHAETIQSLNGLAATLFTRGEYAEAARLFEHALEIDRKNLGPDHPHTLMLANNLAAAHLELGDYSEAEPVLRSVAQRQLRVHGESHGQTSTAFHNLGVTLLHMARYEAAEEALSKASAIRERLSGSHSEGHLYSHSFLADVYRLQGRFEAAKEAYQQVVADQREHIGAEHEHTLRTACGLAELRIAQGKLDVADRGLTEVLDSLQTADRTKHPDTLHIVTTQALLRIEQGRPAEALEICDEAIETAGSTLAADHPALLETQYQRARALAALDERAAAREVAEHVFEARTVRLGAEHPATQAAEALLATLRSHPRQSSRGPGAGEARSLGGP